MRKIFESWFRTHFNHRDALNIRSDGTYYLINCEIAWQTWQACQPKQNSYTGRPHDPNAPQILAKRRRLTADSIGVKSVA